MVRHVRSLSVNRSSGDAFRDLSLSRAEEKQTKIRLAIAVNDVVVERKLTQQQAARVLQITQPKVSALTHFHLEGFSAERLMNFLNALGRDVEIVIRRKPKSRRAGRISIKAA